MPRTTDEQFYIEINDFRPGIVADRHGSSDPRFTAAQDAVGVHPGVSNGMARVNNTSGCIADEYGHLVPLPRRIEGSNDPIRPGLNLQPMRPFRYVLDAQVANELVDQSETEAAPFPEPTRRTVQVMWGYYVTTES